MPTFTTLQNKTMSDKITLPALADTNSEDIVTSITTSLGFPRTVLASHDDIENVWGNLVRQIDKVKLEYRHEMLARMVVSIRVGLFSSAVNEMWNTTILALRDKVTNFGLDEANQFLSTTLDEKKFKELKDKELLDICVELGLLGEDSYFFLNHCREIRNKYSSAHPSNQMLDGDELNYFIHQNVKQVLSNDIVFIGFRSDEFMRTLKSNRLGADAQRELTDRIKKTNELQKSAIIKALFGLYVDERNDEFVRQNTLDLSIATWNLFNERAKAELAILYSGYLLLEDTKKQYARNYFEKVDALDILPKDEQVSIISKIIKQLESTHHDINNFYNETAFAERLNNIRKSIPLTIIKDFVYVISLCFVGNSYGTSRSAEIYYKEIIENFTVREIDKLFELRNEDNYLKYRVENSSRCKSKWKELLGLLNSDSIPTKWKDAYNHTLGIK
jgi:hypothetical protein